MPNRTILAFVVAIAAGLVCSILVSRIMTPPMAAIEQVLTPGDTEITVLVFPGDQVAGILEPGQIVDVIAEQSAEQKPPVLSLVAEHVQVVALEKPRPQGSPAEGKPDAAIANQITLRVTKQQSELLNPYQRSGTLRFVVRQRPDKK